MIEPRLVEPGVHTLELEVACFGHGPPLVVGASQRIRALAEGL
jgi:hypothetical protein